MKIVFDNIIFARQKHGGISVVWYELISRFLRDKADVHFIDFKPCQNMLRNSLEIPESKLTIVNSKWRKILKYIPVFYKSKEPFIFHSSYYRYCLNRKAINVTTVHDFTNEFYMNGLGALKDRWIKHNAIRHSDYIVCISGNTKKDFMHFFPKFPENRIKVIYNGVSEDYHPIDYRPVSLCPFQSHSYLLFIGDRGGYKNFNLVVEALKQYDINLVIIGGELSQKEQDSLSLIKGKYHYAGRVSNKTLNEFYNDALALVYPSSYEGFGLPVIEAQRAGCPVIAYRASSIPEIIGETPLLLDTLTSEELISKIQLLTDQGLRQQIVSTGITNAARFSWEYTYQSMKQLYNQSIVIGNYLHY